MRFTHPTDSDCPLQIVAGQRPVRCGGTYGDHSPYFSTKISACPFAVTLCWLLYSQTKTLLGPPL